MVREDDEAWRAIVDNYGEAPQFTDEELDGPADGPSDGDAPATAAPTGSTYDVPTAPDAPDWGVPGPGDVEERFVPPVPPPLPRPTRDRALAWAGLFGSPAVLLFCLVLGIALPRLVSYLLVGAFVGGFCYLVWQMPSGPRDPGDDGAVV